MTQAMDDLLKSFDAVAVPAVSDGKGRARQIETLKMMCRLLERRRRKFLEEDWRNYADLIPQQQFIHLMMVRSSLPCNLARIMQLTGLTSAGASIFVNKLVKLSILERMDDPTDRRNVIIRFSPRAAAITARIEERLNRYVCGFFNGCTDEELATLTAASELVCRVLGPEDGEGSAQPGRGKRSRG